jgi:hypothetical protein
LKFSPYNLTSFQVEDLVKIKLVDRIRLDNISRFLTVNNADQDDIGGDFETPRSSILTNGFHIPSSNDRKSNGGPLKLPLRNGLSSSSLFDIFELLSAYSPRPILEDTFSFTRKGEPAIRLATWNLHDFSTEKANNPGVKEVVCRTILENGLVMLFFYQKDRSEIRLIGTTVTYYIISQF